MDREKPRKGSAALWLLVVLLIGIVAGVVLSALPTPTTSTSGRGPGWHLQLSTASDFDVVLSTVGIVLIAALLTVYVRIYAETRANFGLGLVVVLLALLVESILTSPLVYTSFGASSDSLGTFLAFADAFKVVAFAVFLYLSLV